MVGSRSSRVTDANIWIDLLEGGLIPVVLRLSFDCVIPDVIMHDDLSEATRNILQAHGVQERELPPDQVREVVRLAAIYRHPSRTDLFALAMAKWQGTILLSGDRHLRTAAEREGVEVHGTLWLLEQMIEERAITEEEAAVALQQMVDRGRRLPPDAVRRYLDRWRSGTP